MPIYPFKCSECGHEEDVLLSRVVNSLSCSQCRGISVRQMTSPAVIKVQGSWNTPRGRWARDWSPQSPKFHVGSRHGEKY